MLLATPPPFFSSYFLDHQYRFFSEFHFWPPQSCFYTLGLNDLKQLSVTDFLNLYMQLQPLPHVPILCFHFLYITPLLYVLLASRRVLPSASQPASNLVLLLNCQIWSKPALPSCARCHPASLRPPLVTLSQALSTSKGSSLTPASPPCNSFSVADRGIFPLECGCITTSQLFDRPHSVPPQSTALPQLVLSHCLSLPHSDIPVSRWTSPCVQPSASAAWVPLRGNPGPPSQAPDMLLAGSTTLPSPDSFSHFANSAAPSAITMVTLTLVTCALSLIPGGEKPCPVPPCVLCCH